MDNTYYKENGFTLCHGDCLDIMQEIHDIDMIFADPPYFLSNGGLTIKSGKVVSVNKAEWDAREVDVDVFNYNWLKVARETLKPNGTIWISGTVHNIYSVVRALTDLDFKILNTIVWQKRNPPPNFSCRTFTHSTELIIWARKEKSVAHCYNYDLMKAINGGKQMKDVWAFNSIQKWEKECGKHPTQKPLSVLSRIVLSSSKKGDIILDPFCGSSTTGIAANLFGRQFIGIDNEIRYLDLSKERFNQVKKEGCKFMEKIEGISTQFLGLDI